jgi:hypothetical protein
MAKLTTRTLATGASLNDLIHIVITGDTSQSIDGSSYKASLSQLVPLFGGSPDIQVTGGTSNSSGGTLTFTNNTGGTFTVSGLTTPFTGGSSNCITSFYTNNIHACLTEITVHNRVQSVGSDAQNTLSFAFGNNVQALSNYSHAEGVDTIASGDTSHAEGSNTKSFGSNSHSEGTNTRAGTNNAYLATGLTSGVLYLSSVYGDVSTNFNVDLYIWIHDQPFGGSLNDDFKKVSGSTFSGGQTIVYLYDTALSTTNNLYVGDTSIPDTWSGNQTAGGRSANVKGFASGAIGTNSFASGQGNISMGWNSFTANKGNQAFGNASAAFGTSNKVYGTSSISFGDSNVLQGASSITTGNSNEIFGDFCFAGGTDNSVSAQSSFVFGEQNIVNNESGAILGGILNTVQSGVTQNSTILGGENNSISGLTPSDPVHDSSIIGGSGNTVQSFSSVIVGGDGNLVSGSRSVVLGGTNITGTASDTAYVPNIVLAFSGTPSGSADTLGEPGSLLWDNTYFYYKDNTGWKRLSGSTF